MPGRLEGAMRRVLCSTASAAGHGAGGGGKGADVDVGFREQFSSWTFLPRLAWGGEDQIRHCASSRVRLFACARISQSCRSELLFRLPQRSPPIAFDDSSGGG